ncbi:MAG: GDP-mannose 4,6-dehydratase [Candidatus Staskawiczbacteria bacterium]|nr:GDP-mannose 4,6-dehydratase [Candidatus Staskawiczbacteria bacterium]
MAQSNQKKALILGVTGQDGSYLAEILLEKGYEVHGMIRRSATGNTKNIDHLINNREIFEKLFFLHKGDLADMTSLYRIVSEVHPEEIYNEADQDHVVWSFSIPSYSYDITGAAVGRILEIIKQVDPKIKFFQPCSSNMFGKAIESPQNENTPFNPQSPYACAKILAKLLAGHYRTAYGIFVCTAIFYNHESPRRTEEYVTRKITKAAAKISLGLQDKLMLGDLDAKIDWGYAKEYMEAAWNIMQLNEPGDFIISTGEVHSVREFAEASFKFVGLDYKDYVFTDKKFLRPANTSVLVGDISKAKNAFGYEPKVKITELARIMVESDLEEAKRGKFN